MNAGLRSRDGRAPGLGGALGEKSASDGPAFAEASTGKLLAVLAGSIKPPAEGLFEGAFAVAGGPEGEFERALAVVEAAAGGML